MANPGPSSSSDFLFDRSLLCLFPQFTVADGVWPVDLEDSSQAVVDKYDSDGGDLYGYFSSVLDHSCISALDVICHLQTPGWIILAMFLNVKCCRLCVLHHSYQVK